MCFHSERLATQHPVIPIRNNQQFPGNGWISRSRGVKNGAILWYSQIQKESCFETFAAPHVSVICSLWAINRNGWKTSTSNPPENSLLWICSSLCFVMKWKNMNFGAVHLKWAWNPLRKVKCHLRTHASTSGIIHGHGEGLHTPRRQTFP